MPHFNKYINSKGLIHVGACGGGEYEHYVGLGIKHLIFFEPQQYWYDQLLKNQREILSKYSGRTTDYCIKVAVGNFNGSSEMYIADNGASSSLLEPKVHLIQHPEVLFNKTEIVPVIRLDDFWKTSNIEPTIFDTLVVDTQGYELEVLRGAINTLKHINVCEIEVERVELYSGSAQIDQIDKFFTEHGFQRRIVSWCGGTWGDAVYVKLESGNIERKMIENLGLTYVNDHWCLKLSRNVKIHLFLYNNTCLLQIEDSDGKIVHEDLFLDYDDLITTFKTRVVECGG